jgi:hypothetical protein
LNNLVASLVLAQAAAKLSQQHQQQQQTSTVTAPAPSMAQSWSVPGHTNLYNATPHPPPATLPNASGTLPILNLADVASMFPVVPPQDVSQATSSNPRSIPQVATKQEQVPQIKTDATHNNVLTKEQRLKAAYEEQQKALRLAFEQSLKQAQEEERQLQAESVAQTQATATSVKDPEMERPSCSNNSTKQMSPAQLLQRSYEAHLASLQKEEQDGKSSIASSILAAVPPSLQVTSRESTDVRSHVKKEKKKKSRDTKDRAKEDDDEGRQLVVGFLQSLRGSFEDAMGKNVGWKVNVVPDNEQVRKERKKKKLPSSRPRQIPAEIRNGNVSNRQASPKPVDSSTKMTSIERYQNRKRKMKAASVTVTSSGSSSQPTTEQSSSSLDDSDSKSEKTDQSSTSDEFENDDSRKSKGPPRKRLKSLGSIKGDEFTVENVLEHSKRMDLEQAEDSGSASD